jgi:hypothetical protein
MFLPSLILSASPLASSSATSSIVKSLALTSRPSAPATCSLNERMLLSMPAPRIVSPFAFSTRPREIGCVPEES